MNKLLGLFLRLLLILLLLGLLGAGAYLLHTRLDWSLWEIGALALGCLALLLGVLLVRRLYYRHREERFLRQMVEHDRPLLSPQEEEVRLTELRDRWRKGVHMLRHSGLGHGSSALYSLPWFMIFGEAGTGKSTAVSHARLSAQASDAGPLAHVTNTRNCDWWFFEKAVVIDTAGRYAVPQNEEEDNREWEEFLRLLAAHRRREPLNGLILTLSVEQLQTRSPEALADYGRLVRKRINSMHAALGATFPVYVLVTKMDRVLGLTSLASLLTPDERRQVLGLLNREKKAGDALAFLETALQHLRGRLQDLSLLLAAREREQAGHTDLPPGTQAVLLPAEMEQLFPGIRAFVRAVFGPSHYGHTPMLRGLFLCSGRQEGSVHTALLEQMPTFAQCRWNLPGTSASLFLEDFFTTILPRERALSRQNDSLFSVQTLRRRAPYILWLSFLLLLGAYFSLCFVLRMQIVETARNDIPARITLAGDMNRRVQQLSDVADRIRIFEADLHRHAWLLLGADQSWQALQEMRARFTAWVRSSLLVLYPDQVAPALQRLPENRRRMALIYFCDYQAWTHRVLQAAEEGKPLPQAKDALDAFARDLQEVVPSGSAQLNNVLAAYASWEEPELRRTQMAQQSLRVDAYLDLLGTNLDWVVQWLNSRPSIAPVTMANFWPRGPKDPCVPAAYTIEGYERMQGLLKALENASQDKNRFATLSQAFLDRYARDFHSAWWRLADTFSQALHYNDDQQAWRRITPTMAGQDNPYFAFIQSMDEAFRRIEHLNAATELDRLPGRFAELLRQLSTASEPQTLQSTLHQKTEQLTTSLDARRAREYSERHDEAKLLQDYLADLARIREVTGTDAEALQLIAQGYAGGQEAAKTPVSAALAHLAQLQAQMDMRSSEHDQFWRLVKGPLAWQTIFAVYRSACELNNLWEGSVLSQIDEQDPDSLWTQLFDEQSALNTFVHGPAAPFLKARTSGWQVARWLGIGYPLTPEFLNFLDQSKHPGHKARDKYVIGITAHPVNVNEMAQKPHRVRLRLECGPDMQTLDNYNYLISKDFTWEPATCGRVSLSISFESQTVTTSWDGDWAFQTFLHDFAGGELVLTPADFPGQEAVLRELDVEEIRVRYTFKGADDALMAQRFVGLSLPGKAAFCPTRMDSLGGEDERLSDIQLPNLPSAPLR